MSSNQGKEPTMTEFEQNLSEQILAVFAEYGVTAKKAGAGKAIRDLLTSHARPAAGFIREATGPDRKVLGTLPVTADGVVVLPGAKVWPHASLFVNNVPENTEWTVDEEAAEVRLSLRAECDVEDWDVSKCYSTPAAAQAERGDQCCHRDHDYDGNCDIQKPAREAEWGEGSTREVVEESIRASKEPGTWDSAREAGKERGE